MGSDIEVLADAPIWGPAASKEARHGTVVAACAMGQNIGIARKSTLVFVPTSPGTGDNGKVTCTEKILEGLVRTMNDIATKDNGKQAVVVMAWSIFREYVPVHFMARMSKFARSQRLAVEIH